MKSKNWPKEQGSRWVSNSVEVEWDEEVPELEFYRPQRIFVKYYTPFFLFSGVGEVVVRGPEFEFDGHISKFEPGDLREGGDGPEATLTIKVDQC